MDAATLRKSSAFKYLFVWQQCVPLTRRYNTDRNEVMDMVTNNKPFAVEIDEATDSAFNNVHQIR
jgi:hypothetical protein